MTNNRVGYAGLQLIYLYGAIIAITTYFATLPVTTIHRHFLTHRVHSITCNTYTYT